MTDRSPSRLRKRVLGVVVLAVATWAAVRLHNDGSTGSAGLELPREESLSRADGPLLSPTGARAAPHARAAAPTPVEGAGSAYVAPLLVTVRAEGVPIPGALVCMYRPNPAGEGLGLEFRTDALAAEQADAGGTARLPRDADGLGTMSQLILRVDVDGYQPSRVVVPAAATEVTIDLQRGLRISGVVETSSGRPVPGLRLVCVPWQHAGLQGNACFPWESSPSTRRARTDDRGAFTIEGLSPGRHALRAMSPGTQLRTRGSDRHATPFLRRGVPVPAGGPEQRLVAEALGVVLLRPVDAATGESLPLFAGGGNVIIRVPGRRDQPLQREPYELQFGQESGRLALWPGPYTEDDDVIMAAVVADDEQALLAGAEAFVEFEGFHAVQQHVRIATLGELSTALYVNEIRVRPELDLGPLTASIRTRESPPPPGARRGALRFAQFTTASGATVSRRGQVESPGVWDFRGLPAGIGTFRVGDGGTNRAQPVSVTLTPERVTAIDLSYAGPASFAVQVVDGAGREVCALALGWSPLDPPSQGEGLIDEMSWPSLSPTGELERLCMQLPAGEYRFSASSYDLGGGLVDVRLEADRFTLVRIPLTTPPSALRGPPR